MSVSRRAVVADAIVTVALIAGLGYAVLNLEANVLRAVLGAFFLLFFPGYGLTTAFFPATKEKRPSTGDLPGAFAARETESAGLPFLERLAVSFGLSVAIVPIVGWALEVSGFAFFAPNVVTVCGSIAVVGVVAGVVRRLRVPDSTRYVVPVSALVAYGSAARSQSGWDGVLNVALAAAIVLSAGVVTFALVSPLDGTHYTQVSLVTENDDGSLVAADYPQNFTAGESGDLILLVENYEDEPTDYSVVIQLQRVEPNGDVTATSELGQTSQSLQPGQTWSHRHSVQPDMTGDNLRVTYLVYRGDAPQNPNIESSYRHVAYWINVSEPGSGANAPSGSATGFESNTTTETASGSNTSTQNASGANASSLPGN